MNDSEINVAIAEACGWKCVEPKPRVKDSPYARWMKGDDLREFRNVPNYAHDLNAMHEAEELLPKHDADTNVPIQYANWAVKYGNELMHLTGMGNPYHATARQRAEALLRTLGKWQD